MASHATNSKPRVKRGAKRKAAAVAAPAAVIFSAWQFYGSDGSVIVSVTVTPASKNYSIDTVLLVVQTPSKNIIAYGSLLTLGAGTGWNLNLTARTDTYDVKQFGTTVQAQAFATVRGSNDQVSSTVQTYHVQT